MPLGNGSLATLKPGDTVVSINFAANRIQDATVVSHDPVSGILRIKFTSKFGFQEVRDVPANWYEFSSAAKVIAGQLSDGSGPMSAPVFDPS